MKWAAAAALALGAVSVGCGGRQEIPLADVPQIELNTTQEENLPPQLNPNEVSPRSQ